MTAKYQMLRTLGILLFVVQPKSIGAQTFVESNNTNIAKKCAAFSKRYAAPTALRTQTEIVELYGCDNTAPDFLVKSWERLPTEASALNALFHVSSGNADRRLLKKLLSIAADTAALFNSRVGALGTLVSFLDPRHGASSIDDPGYPGGRRVDIVSFSHSIGGHGSQPLTAADRDSIRALCRRLGASDPVQDIRYVAQRILIISP